MHKAQHTLNEIHEMAKAKGRKFERMPASAGTKNVGDLPMNPQESPRTDKRTIAQVRHSQHVPEYAGASLDIDTIGNSNYRRGSVAHVEDSLISATSVNDAALGSAPAFDGLFRAAPRTRNTGRRGQTMGMRNEKQYLSNSLMASPEDQYISGEQSLIKHPGPNN